MSKFFHTIVIMLLSGALLSCVKDDYSTGRVKGDQTVISISAGFVFNQTRGFNDDESGDAADKAIKEFRTLIFEDGKLAYNHYIADLSASNPFPVTMLTGLYDFVFIANEGSDPSLAAQLASFTGNRTISQLDNLSFSSAAFDKGKNIPMVQTEKNVQIVGDNQYIIGGVTYTGVWNVAMKRLGVRMDMKIFTESPGKQSTFQKLEIYNVPAKVPLLETSSSGNPLYNGGAANAGASKVLYASDGEGGGFQPASGGGYEWTVSRVILPSSIFNPDNEGNALGISVSYSTGEVSTSAIATGLQGKNYQFPRNTYMVANINIMQTFEIYLEAEDWDLVDLSGTVAGEKASLNVSAFSATINERNRARIWFWSDQPEDKVFIEPKTAGQLNVNDLFNDLAAPSAHNFHYSYDASTKQGVGYFDIMTDRSKIPVGTSSAKHTIYLNAGGLKRAINLTASVYGDNRSIGYFEYVGAFWKNDQMGERLISGRSFTWWTAEIVNGEDWIVLGAGKSLDPNVWTNSEPDDAENYPVEGNLKTVSGTGYVFFRIGLQSKNVGNPPRYGRVHLTGPGLDTHIYIRQGEDPDYLMRREDYGTGKEDSWHEGTQFPRPLAARFGVYNITSSTYKSNLSHSGGTTIGSHPTVNAKGGVFVDFPTQAGAFFQYAEGSTPHAFHPFKPGATTITSYSSNYAGSGYWKTLETSQETCPPNYRRPRAGVVTLGDSDNIQVKYSEIRQSLWIDPTAIGTTTTTANSLFGYYADGFFDRRAVEDAPSSGGTYTSRKSSVCNTQTRIGYTGVLFFNPDNDYNASVFFPTPGIRRSSDGQLWYAGLQGYYWTSGSSGTASSYTMTIQSPERSADMSVVYTANTYLNLMTQGRAGGGNIRCVAE